MTDSEAKKSRFEAMDTASRVTSYAQSRPVSLWLSLHKLHKWNGSVHAFGRDFVGCLYVGSVRNPTERQHKVLDNRFVWS
jgi:hypothetical protein